jgi:hypothetical protein
VDPSTLEIAGAEYETARSAVLGIPIYASGTLDQPVRISIDPPVGQPQTVTLAGQHVIGKGSSPEAGTVTVTYTLKEKGVTVETPSGIVAGCHHFEASGDVPLLFGAASTTVRGELWYSPTLGLVKAQLTAPISLGLGFAGNSDLTDLGDGWVAVQKTGAVGKDAAKTWELSTYDFRQQLDADKDTHAKMLLEVRWVDSTKAKGQQQPYLQEEFGTTMGYFPSTMTQSPVSIFHPEENGQGFVYWIGFVDQAAKNQAVNGISYRISLNRYDPSFSAVRATGRIIYKRFGP